MNRLCSWLVTLFFIFFSFSVYAADIPSVDEGDQTLDNLSCVNEAKQNCIDDVCLTSENMDCEDNCGKLAEQKCQQKQNE